MAQQTKYASWIPHPYNQTALDTATLLVDASGEMAAFIFRIQKTGTLRKVVFRTGTVVQAQTVEVSFQDVSGTTGVPDEVFDQFRTVAVADTDDAVWKTTGLITSDGTDGGVLRSVTRGDVLAVVFRQNPFNAGDVFRLASMASNAIIANGGIYAALKTGGSWARSAQTANVVLVYDDGAGNDAVYYCHDVYPAVLAGITTWNSGSSPAKRGLKFQLPYPCKTLGCQVLVAPAAAGNFIVKLYDSDGSTVLQTSVTYDGDIIRSAGAYGVDVYWPTEQLLLANTNYYILVEPQSANNVSLQILDVNAAGDLDQLEGGTQFHYCDSSSTPPAATTTRRPGIFLCVSSGDDATGGAAGMLFIPSLDGV